MDKQTTVQWVLNGCGLDAESVTGGPVRFHAVSDRWRQTGVCVQRLQTTVGGEGMLRRMGCVLPVDRIRASMFCRREHVRAGRLWSYVLSAGAGARRIRQATAPDAVITVSDYFCDVVPALACLRRHRSTRWIAWIHHQELHPRERPGNWLVNTTTWALQRWSFRQIARHAQQAWVLDTEAGDGVRTTLLRLGMPAARIRRMCNGLDLETIRAVPAQTPDIDAVMVGVRPNKGLHDIVPIWQEVCRLRPGSRLRLTGGMSGAGPLLEAIRAGGLGDAIEIDRPVGGYRAPAAYFAKLKQARLLFAPSHEEGWGIAVGEAMACGLPVVAYDLSAYRRIYGTSHVAVPCFDNAAFARAVVRLLEDPAAQAARRAEGLARVTCFGWSRIAADDWQAVAALLVLAHGVDTCQGDAPPATQSRIR